MKFLRSKLIRRSVAVFLLLNFLQTSLVPAEVWALTTGPHQPEYISYEGSGSPDMVNLSTGDFTFSLPVLEVPGPEGSFSLPLSYHGGVGLDQEASWVGLGWTMNPGAITRSINEFPDDASGESHSIQMKDLNVIRGWTSSILGFGQIGWNNQTGHHGTVSLLGLVSYSYDAAGPNSLGIAGVNVSSSGVTVDPMGVAMAAFTIATMGAGGAFANTTAFLKDFAISSAAGAVMSTVFSSQTPGVGANGFWSYSKKVKQKLFHKNYWIWLDKTRTEQMFGVLNLHSAITQNYPSGSSPYASNLSLKVNGATTGLKEFVKSSSGSSHAFQSGLASDMSYFIGSGSYYDKANPSALAPDDYNVQGPGISGVIQPYRFEIGSLSMPREMSSIHERLAPVLFENYKVPFLYQGSNASAYYFHSGAPAGGSAPTGTFNAGINTLVGNSNPPSNTSLTLDMNDYIFGSTNRVAANVASVKKLPQQNHVEWFSNNEVKTTAISQGFIDFTPNSTLRNTFRSNFDFGQISYYSSDDDFTNGQVTLQAFEISSFAVNDNVQLVISHMNEDGNIQTSNTYSSQVQGVNTTTNVVTLNVSGVNPTDLTETAPSYLMLEIILNKSPKAGAAIGGYSVTNGNGMTYHYALPVYDHSLVSKIVNKDDANKFTLIKRERPFANTWLLTAITGSDYYDSNSNGFPDAGDWGYWVRLNYGRHTTAGLFHWRAPYEGTRLDAENKTRSYSEGWKEQYYLNSIQTRTHTAIFFKEDREDGKGFSNEGNQLRLKEVYLISNETYDHLTGASGFNLGSCAGVISKSWKLSDLTNNPSAQAYLSSRALKQVVFNYDYDLSKGTLNSDAPGGEGKLTLKSLSIRGRNNQKIMPDYKFEYAYNPNYNKDYWDAFGFYNGTNSRIPLYNNTYGSAWSLTKIITPLGHEIVVNYERDDYAYIWGTPVINTESLSDSDWSDGIPVANTALYKVGQQVRLWGTVGWSCDGFGMLGDDFDMTASVTEVGSNYIKVSQVPPPGDCVGTMTNYQVNLQIDAPWYKNGGNLRVASIVTQEGSRQYKTRYIYTQTGLPGDLSSGAVSREPDYVAPTIPESAASNLPGFPNTPVIYGRVAVLQGLLTTDSDFTSKTEYYFQTPHHSHITYTKTNLGSPKQHIYKKTNSGMPVDLEYNEFLTKTTHELNYYTSRIGRLDSMKVFDQNNTVRSTSRFLYLSTLPNSQGVYTEGTILADRIRGILTSIQQTGWFPVDQFLVKYSSYTSISRTYKKEHPNVLYKVVNSKDGFTDWSEDTVWDFNTGMTLEKVTQSSLGLRIKSVSKPAYQVYPTMGPKANNANPTTNRNMVNAFAAEYSYKLNSANAIESLISASVTTWKKNWNTYRYVNAGVYTQGSEGPDVWRKYKQFSYTGTYAARLNDGTLRFNTANEYSFTAGAPNAGWKELTRTLRFDHYSMPVEVQDLYGRYSASKTDLTGTFPLASASNARYFEFAFSGAEDGDNTKPFFGGEIQRKDGSIIVRSVAGDVHSGNKAVQVGAGQKTFVFKPDSLTANRTYRVSVWTKSLQGAIYYVLNGGAEQTVLPVSTVKAGLWYQVNAEISVSNFTSLEVGVKSTSGNVVFDDFRFQPVDAEVTANVYNPVTGDIDCVLDNNNLYTRYEYNDRGLLTKTYRESLKYQDEYLLTETRDNYKRFHTQQ